MPLYAPGAKDTRGFDAKHVVTFVSILILLLGPLFMNGRAQSASATLSGTILDETGAVVPNAKVRVLNKETARERETDTGDEGHFVIPLLPPGRYSLTAKREGFAAAEIKEIVLEVGDQIVLTLNLKVAAIGVQITILEGSGGNQDSAAVGTVINRQFVQNLPLNGRSFQSLITLIPGVVATIADSNRAGQFSVNGQRANANYFMVDGVSANIGLVANSGAPAQQLAGTTPGLTSFGGTNSLVSIDALQEFKIETSTYAAEFGHQPGGQISLVTRSGTNQFTGSLFEYFRNEALDANDWFSNRAGVPKSPMRHNQFGGVLGGPVWLPRLYDGRNRTFFFFSYEGLRLRLPQTLVTPTVPSVRIRQQAAPAVRPFLDAIPLPTGPESVNANGQPTGRAPLVASFSNPQTLNATSVRADHAFNDKLTLFGRYNDSPSSGSTRRSDHLATITTNDTSIRTLTLGLTSLFTPRLNNELRVNYSEARAALVSTLDDFGGAVPADYLALLPSSVSRNRAAVFVLFRLGGQSNTSSLGTTQDYRQRQVNIANNLSFVSGSHQWKVGIDYRRLAPIFGPAESLQQYDFNDENSVRTGIASQFFNIAREGARPLFVNFSAFAQDVWRVSPRLTLTGGLRWELNPPPGGFDGRKPLNVIGLDKPATAVLAPAGDLLYKTVYRNFAPRIGVAYRLRQATVGGTLLRGGFGIFYDLGSGAVTNGLTQFTFQEIKRGVPFPVPLEQNRVPVMPDPRALPITGTILATDQDLQLPYTLQWNVALEQSLGRSQSVSASYVAAAGRRLLVTRRLRNPNPNFAQVIFTTNGSTSDYHSLQMQYRRRLVNGLQALASYTWAHAIDEVSDDLVSSNVVRGNAGFDIRHNFSSAVTYDLPSPRVGGLAYGVLKTWSIDTIIHAQTGLPQSIVAGTILDEFGQEFSVRPNLVEGVPIYLKDPGVPGGRVINSAAFRPPPSGRQGTVGRNVIRLLNLYQVDFALRRELYLSERVKLHFRAEAFNLFNHPNFGAINTVLPTPTNPNPSFGQPGVMLGRTLSGLSPLYQIGGPRSLQFTLRLGF